MSNTTVIIASTGQEFNLPGTHWTTEQVVSSFQSSVPNIGSLQAEVTNNGDNKTITFRPRTGTKGC